MHIPVIPNTLLIAASTLVRSVFISSYVIDIESPNWIIITAVQKIIKE
jgi:hypothetical protein